jgi:hypothetical protein
VHNDGFGIPALKPKKKKIFANGWGDEDDAKVEEVVSPFAAELQTVLQQVLKTQPQYLSTTPKRVPDRLGVTTYYSYGQIFNAHIRVFLFADYHQVDNLSNQALERLRWSFTNCQVENSDVIEVTERYVKGDLPDSLRELVLAYIASQATRMWDDDQFQVLLQEDAGMAFELLSIVMEAAKT